MQIEKYIADKITSLCEKCDISKYRLSQLSGISQSSLGRIMAQENLPSLITLEKICAALGVTLSQFFQEGNSENLTEKQKEVLRIWNNLSTNEQGNSNVNAAWTSEVREQFEYMYRLFFFCFRR